MKEIVILDFGSQYTHLIARRIRELGTVSHIYPNNIEATKLKNAVGIILSGGPKSILSEDKLDYDKKIFDLGIPILGLCYGHQLIANHFGGTVGKGKAREYGTANLHLSSRPKHSEMDRSLVTPTCEPDQNNIFKDIPKSSTVWMSHGDHVEKIPAGFIEIATSLNNSVTAMENPNKKIFGFQFHPEVHHSEFGKQMLQNFIFDICKAEKNWSNSKMLEQIQDQIKQDTEDKKVFLLISGGVDSTVCFALLEKVLGKNRVYGFHVDHGFMRLGESEKVRQALLEIGLDNLHVYNAKNEFLLALNGVTEPEEKRKIIGDLFLDITNRKMKELNFEENNWLLGQGTIYPDTIESGGTKNSDKIKTHHNRVDRVTEMIKKGLIIEPIKELYKDEVREIGLALGLPSSLIKRHPFPGPGLAIRILCSNGSSDLPKKLNFENYNLLKLPIKSVGVQGDERTYFHPVVLLNNINQQNNPATTRERRAKTEEVIDWKKLHTLSPTITNKTKGVNRVLITLFGSENKLSESKLKSATLTKDRIEKLQILDDKINKIIDSHSETKNIWQMPIVLVPFGHNHSESLVLRPVISNEAMTVKFAELSNEVINEIKSLPEVTTLIDFIFLDITNKPPGTIEWE